MSPPPQNDLPMPLVSVSTDVRDLDGFMLNVERMLASELWALSTGEEFKAAFALWMRAWKQVPAGSLPDDERILAAFSGAGRRWPKVREMALRGFTKCSDGRLYHRVLCEDVKRAAEKKAEFRERTKAATEARKRRQESERDDQRYESRNDERNGCRNDPGNTNVTTSQGQGQGQVIPPSEEKKAAGAASAPIPRVEAFQLAEVLRSSIANRDPKSKAARNPDEAMKWAHDIDALIRIDGRDPPTIQAVIAWAQMPGCFWAGNILSGKKLREKFDTLYAQMTEREGRGSNASDSRSDQGNRGQARAFAGAPEYVPKQ